MKQPKAKSWDEVAEPYRRAAKAAGLTRRDVERMINKCRKEKAANQY